MRRGFTLIEVMVVVAVIAILAMMAFPTYQDKLVRDQVTEALPLADIAKAPVAAGWTLLKLFPADNAAAGLPPPGVTRSISRSMNSRCRLRRRLEMAGLRSLCLPLGVTFSSTKISS